MSVYKFPREVSGKKKRFLCIPRSHCAVQNIALLATLCRGKLRPIHPRQCFQSLFLKNVFNLHHQKRDKLYLLLQREVSKKMN